MDRHFYFISCVIAFLILGQMQGYTQQLPLIATVMLSVYALGWGLATVLRPWYVRRLVGGAQWDKMHTELLNLSGEIPSTPSVESWLGPRVKLTLDSLYKIKQERYTTSWQVLLEWWDRLKKTVESLRAEIQTQIIAEKSANANNLAIKMAYLRTTITDVRSRLSGGWDGVPDAPAILTAVEIIHKQLDYLWSTSDLMHTNRYLINVLTDVATERIEMVRRLIRDRDIQLAEEQKLSR